MKILGCYNNGNYMTTIWDDGTKIRETEEDEFIPSFAENMDIKITNYCDGACVYCHEGSSPIGSHADIMNAKFIETLHPFQELAVGGGDTTSHPDLIPFLEKLKEQKVIANITVNQKHFMEKQDLIKELVEKELVHGIGVSLVAPKNDFIKMVKQYPNAVIHVINGVLDKKDVRELAGNDLKMLILGYKHLRRGNDWYRFATEGIKENQRWLNDNLSDVIGGFKVISFDNLAIEQLNVRRLMSAKQWEEFYMGKDGTSTFYIDMVRNEFAKMSTMPLDQRFAIKDGMTVDDMFERIRNESSH